MNPDHSRMKRRSADRPLPPVRTLRGDIHAPPAPKGAWIRPVRSGLVRPLVAPAEPVPDAAPEGVRGLQPLAQPLTREEASSLPVATWSDVAPEAAETELVLEDEVFWVDDPDAVVDALDHGDAVAPIEGLTVAGDVAGTEPQPSPDEPPVHAWDLSSPRTPTDAEEDEQQAWERSGWEVLSRAFAESALESEPGEEAAPEPVAADEPEVLDAAFEPEAADERGIRDTVMEAQATTTPEGPDPTALANRLERLADRLRMHGSDALDESRGAADPMEAALAAALASMLEHREQ